MKITLIESKKQPEFETNIWGIFQDEIPLNMSDPELKDLVSKLGKKGVFSGKTGEVRSIVYKSDDIKKDIFVGLGKKKKVSEDIIRKAVGTAVQAAEKLNTIKTGFIGFADRCKISRDVLSRLIIESSLLALYKFDKYFSDKKETNLKSISLVYDKITVAEKKAVKEGEILAECTILARELVNEPANILTPAELANQAQEAGKKYGFRTEILNRDQIKKLGMKAYLSVARASDNPPVFIIMRYSGDPENKEIIGMAGKGLTFDSGGYSLKTSAGMLRMNGGMGGSAAVIGSISAISALKLKINVVAVVAACENMVSGKGYRPGDIIGSMAGKSIYIGNTDAEGRLTLIDAVTYLIKKENATKIVDIATLTGAAVVALGHIATPVISNDDKFYRQLEKASARSGEKIWRLPTFEEYKELLKAKNADLTNSPGNPGTITAGLFIGEFVESKPWLHLDIAGTSFKDKDQSHLSRGATGAGVRILYNLAKINSKGLE